MVSLEGVRRAHWFCIWQWISVMRGDRTGWAGESGQSESINLFGPLSLNRSGSLWQRHCELEEKSINNEEKRKLREELCQ